MRALVAAIVVAAGVAAGVAHAGPAETEALAHLDRGVAAYRARDFVLAHKELEAAHELAPDRPNPYRWLALTEVELGNCKAALVDVESFLSRVPNADPRVAELVKLRERCVLELQAERPPARPEPVPPRPPPPPPAESHRWWLWGAIGAGAVLAGVVTYAVVRDSGPAQLPPITCDPSGCRR